MGSTERHSPKRGHNVSSFTQSGGILKIGDTYNYSPDEKEKCLQGFYLTDDAKDSSYEWFKNDVKTPEKDTCKWFLNDEHYKSWLERGSGPLVVTADPGCGKSVLARYLVDVVLQSRTEKPTVCYFFFKDRLQDRLSQALCAMLHQLLSANRSLIEYAMPHYSSKGPGLKTATQSLWEIFEQAVRHHARPVICVLDALDECDERDCQDVIKKLSNFFSPNNQVKQVKFILTSRPYSSLTSKFGNLVSGDQCIHIPGEQYGEKIRQEVELVIEARVPQLATEKKLSKRQQDCLLKELRRAEHRTYLWIHLVFAELKDLPMDDEMERKFSKLPRGIKEVYENILEKSTDKEKAKRVLNILLAAQRPLNLDELHAAITIDISLLESRERLSFQSDARFEQTLRGWCGLLVSVYQGRVHFLHQTVREFLLLQAPSIDTTPHVRLLDWSEDIPLIEVHKMLEDLTPTSNNEEIEKQIWRTSSLEALEALRRDEHETILQLLRRKPMSLDDARKSLGELYTAAEKSRVVRIWRESFNLQQAHSALAELCVNYLHLLSSSTAESNSNVFLAYSATHWHDHFREAHFGTKAQKLANSALAICSPKSVSYKIWFPIFQRQRLIVAQLQNEDPVILSSFFGHEVVVKLLLEKGAELETKDDYGRTPLSYAAGNGQEMVVKLLLEEGAELETKDNYGRTPLSYAAWIGPETAIKLLLEEGAELETKDNDGWTPLLYAAENGHETVVKLLLEEGAELETKDNDGRTALSYAAENGHETVMKLLLEKGAELETKDDYGRTPLSYAAGNGQEMVVKLLLEGGAELETKDNYGRTPLSYATWIGPETAIKLLLEEGAEPETKDNDGWTPLLYAAENGHETVVKLLLEEGAELETKDNDGRTALSYAAENGHETVVKLLLEEGAELETKDNDGWTPLLYAAGNGQKAVVELLRRRNPNDL